MRDLDDLDLNKAPAPLELERRRTGWRVVLAVALLAVLGFVAWNLFTPFRRATSDAQTTPGTQVPHERTPRAPSAQSGETADLPPLGDTDPLVRRLVQQLSSHPRVAAWLATDQLIRNFTVVVVNIADGRTPAKHLNRLRPTGAFVARATGESARIAPESYARYNDYADAVDGLDAAATARLYATLKPRIQDAYRELGHPDGDFDAAFTRAIVELLNTPVPDRDVQLTQRSVAYEFADPRLQSLSSAQRQFLRMGPRNMRIVQAKLREMALRLGLAAESVPQ